MTKGPKIWSFVIVFILGCLTTYISCQWEYFKFDYEINVADLVVASLGLAIGIYIAMVLEGKKTRNQNFYSYVETKFESLWQDFISLHEKLEYSSNMELKEISKDFSSMDKKTGPLKKIFEAFDYNTECILSIEEKLEELNNNLTSSLRTENNVVNLRKDKDKLIQDLNQINDLFAKSYKTLNNHS
jgi:hypothetical protein